MLAFKLAFRNLMGAGLRTWLNVFILSISFVVIIFHKGLLDGWDKQARHDLIHWEYGGGQYWNNNYDPYDPLTYSDGHSKIPEAFQPAVQRGELLPILVEQGTIYPEGRIQPIRMKGIKADQTILDLPTKKYLSSHENTRKSFETNNSHVANTSNEAGSNSMNDAYEAGSNSMNDAYEANGSNSMNDTYEANGSNSMNDSYEASNAVAEENNTDENDSKIKRNNKNGNEIGDDQNDDGNMKGDNQVANPANGINHADEQVGNADAGNMNDDELKAIIGTTTAKNNQLDSGDYVTLRWRDVNGTFDARDVLIAGIFRTDVPSVDVGQIWIPLEQLQGMLKTPGEASVLVKSNADVPTMKVEGWTFKDHGFLLADMDAIIQSKNVGGSIFWTILVLLAMIAIFDTQVLSIFRRQKEIGTYIALGMTKKQVIGLFTVEGAFHSILAILVGAVYGVPLFIWQSNTGIRFPMESQDFGMAMAEVMYPAYSMSLVMGTIAVVVIATLIVSYLPTRKISKLKPTEALRGKLQ